MQCSFISVSVFWSVGGVRGFVFETSPRSIDVEHLENFILNIVARLSVLFLFPRGNIRLMTMRRWYKQIRVWNRQESFYTMLISVPRSALPQDGWALPDLDRILAAVKFASVLRPLQGCHGTPQMTFALISPSEESWLRNTPSGAWGTNVLLTGDGSQRDILYHIARYIIWTTATWLWYVVKTPMEASLIPADAIYFVPHFICCNGWMRMELISISFSFCNWL